MNQYDQPANPIDKLKESTNDYQRLKEQIMSRYNLMEERIIVQQNEIAKLNREINRLKNYIDQLQHSIHRRG